MALHISAKLCALGLVLASLVTAFSSERDVAVPLAITPNVTLSDSPREAAAESLPMHGPVANPTLTVRATGYNSLAAQTDATPDITATGTRTRFGVLAVSRDLLGDDLPYGSLVRLKDLGAYHGGRNAGRFQSVLDSQNLFVVEDTMHARKRNQVDVWFGDYTSAVNWGVRQVEVEVVRYGYDGPVLEPGPDSPFEGRPVLTASAH